MGLKVILEQLSSNVEAPPVLDVNGEISRECLAFHLGDEVTKIALFNSITYDQVNDSQEIKALIFAFGTKGPDAIRNIPIVINHIIQTFPTCGFTVALYEVLFDAIDYIQQPDSAGMIALEIIKRIADDVSTLMVTSDVHLHDIWIRCMNLLQSFYQTYEKHLIDKIRKHLLKKLTKLVDWSKNIQFLLLIFQEEFELSEDEFRIAIVRIFKILALQPQKDIGQFIYQTLLLAQRGLCSEILLRCFRFISTQQEKIARDGDERSRRMLEKDILEYSLHAFARDNDLSKCLFTLVKEKELQPTPLIFAIMIGITSFEKLACKEILNLIEEELTKSQQSTKSSSNSNNLQALFTVVSDSPSTFISISESLVNLGFFFLSKMKKSGNHSSVGEIGERMMVKLFQILPSSHESIISSLFTKILHADSNVLVYAELLRSLLKNTGSSASEFVIGPISKNIDHILYHSPEIASILIESMIPALDDHCASHQLDRLIMVLRKSLYDKEQENREIAASGFLTLLKFCSFDKHHTSGGEEEQKILGLLQRCLSQQYSIRKLVYNQLFEVLLRRRDLEDIILKLLHGKLFQYFCEKDQVPFQINECVNQKRGLVEPFADLYFVLQRSIACKKHIGEEYKNVRNTIKKVCSSFVLSQPSDFDFEDKNEPSFDSNNIQGIQNRHRAEILLGCYQVSMQLLLMSNISQPPSNPELGEQNLQIPVESEIVKQIFQLYQNYDQLLKLASKYSRSKGSLRFSDQNIYYISTDALVRFFEVAYIGLSSDSEHPFANTAFIQFLNSIFRRRLHIESFCKDQVGCCFWLLNIIFCEKSELSKINKKSNSICQSILETFEKAYQKGGMKNALNFCDQCFKTYSSETDDCIKSAKYISTFLKVICVGGENGPLQSTQFLKMITILSTQLTKELQVSHLIELLHYFKLSGSNEWKAEFIEALFEHLTSVCLTLGDYTPLIALSKEIMQNCGIGQSIREYCIISLNSAKCCVMGILKKLPAILRSMEWTFNDLQEETKCKYKVLKTRYPDEFFQLSDEKLAIERDLCIQLMDLITTVRHIVIAHPKSKVDKVLEDIDALIILKVVEQIYKLLGGISKFRDTYTKHSKYVPDYFVKVAHECNRLGGEINMLIQFLYKHTDKKSKSRLSKETKQLSSLIFVREKCDSYLIGLSVRTHTNLMEYAEKILVSKLEISRKRLREADSPGTACETIRKKQKINNDEAIVNDD